MTLVSRYQSREQPIPGLNNPDKLVLYSIDGADNSVEKYERALATGNEVFWTYAVLGKVEIRDARERARLVAALNRAATWPDGPPEKCFWPRHAVVAIEGDRRQEILICFQCRQYTFDGKSFPLIGHSAQALLNEHLKRAGIATAP